MLVGIKAVGFGIIVGLCHYAIMGNPLPAFGSFVGAGIAFLYLARKGIV